MQLVQAQKATRNVGETWLRVLGSDYPDHRANMSSEEEQQEEEEEEAAGIGAVASTGPAANIGVVRTVA